MKKYLSVLTLISALCAIALPQAQAQTSATATTAKKAEKKKKTSAAHSKASKTAAKKKPAAKSKTHTHAKTESHPLAREVQARHNVAKAAPATASKMPFSSDADDDEREPDIGGTKSADFACEMGNKLTIYKNDADDKHIAIRWNKRINRLTRVQTTTGANRFENHKVGLVWIGIPAKGILLDSKKGQQLANECKNAEQATAAAPTPMAPNS